MNKLLVILVISLMLLAGCAKARIGPIVKEVLYDPKRNELTIVSGDWVYPFGTLSEIFSVPDPHWERFKSRTIKLKPRPQ